MGSLQGTRCVACFAAASRRSAGADRRVGNASRADVPASGRHGRPEDALDRAQAGRQAVDVVACRCRR